MQAIDRRTFVTTLSVVFLTRLAAEAQQQTNIPKVGHLFVQPYSATGHLREAFRQGLRELGYVEGQNISIEFRNAEGRPERLSELASELVRLKVDVIVAAPNAAIQAVKQSTKTIPIVMAASEDPVGSGFVASLRHPGGNITGVTGMAPEVSGKGLELLKEVVPKLSRVAVLWDGDSVVDLSGVGDLRVQSPDPAVACAQDGA
ncbi:MAG: hypothetical protein DMD89_36490 [Candidatus Rokuibacteriota bacterium]|nr:MAG: hypothetical protein DMD89_36490 [Candidatus Rokubacteria bacterium]